MSLGSFHNELPDLIYQTIHYHRKTGDTVWLQRKFCPFAPHLFYENLQPYTNYTFRFVHEAYNGFSMATNLVNVRTAEEGMLT